MFTASLLAVLVQPSASDFVDHTKRLKLTDLILILALAVGIFTIFMLFLKGQSIVLFVFYVLVMGIH